MSSFIDLTSQRFDHLLVLSLAYMKRGKNSSESMWNCLCDCGKEKVIAGHSLRRGRSGSCGCRNRYRGDGGTLRLDLPAEYSIWRSMWQRCMNPRDKHFHLYGGRGILVDPIWQSFKQFIHDVGPSPGKGYSLDRKENSGPYSAKNVHWTTQHIQTRNMSRNRFLTYQGITQCIEDWSRQLGIHRNTITYRVDEQWRIEMILSTKRFTNQGWNI